MCHAVKSIKREIIWLGLDIIISFTCNLLSSVGNSSSKREITGWKNCTSSNCLYSLDYCPNEVKGNPTNMATFYFIIILDQCYYKWELENEKNDIQSAYIIWFSSLGSVATRSGATTTIQTRFYFYIFLFVLICSYLFLFVLICSYLFLFLVSIRSVKIILYN